MRILGWPMVGLFYYFMVRRNLLNSTGSACANWPFCSSMLTPEINTLLFMASILIFSTLIAFACAITWTNPIVENAPAKIKRLALAGLGGLLIQFALGSEVRQLNAGAACPNFPACLDSFFPIPFTYATAIAFAHRWWGFLLLGHFFHLALAAARTSPPLAGPTRRVFALSVAQVFLGIGTVLSGLNAHSRIFHAAVGYALWGTLFFVVIRAGGVRWLWAPFKTIARNPSQQS
ncbi:MAG: COX15/CtaA family protein [Bdellovibrionia bacterium]